MSTMRRIAFALLFLLLGVLVGWQLGGTTVTTTALSPDDQTQAVLVEVISHFDRNFAVRVGPSGAKSSSLATIFQSPDEGRPVGSERFIWPKDGTHLLLVGRHFYVTGQTRMTTGEDVYLLDHLPTKRLWCNASQSRWDQFNFQDLRGVEFTEQITEAKDQKEPPK